MYNANNQNRKSTKIVKIALILSWIIIIGGVYYVFFWNGGNPQPTNQPGTGDAATGSLTSNYYIGERVQTEGEISRVDEFTTYTHKFVTEEGEQFGLKSSDHDLSQYTGSVQIRGTIDDFAQELPIIKVTEIFGPQGRTDGTWGVKNEEFYLFEDVRLGFDLSISQGYDVEEREGTIVLIDTEDENNQVVLTISPFACSSTEALKDCAELEQKFIDYGNESFVSSNDITFYNLTETNTRAAFNGTSYGYYLTPTSEHNLVDFANLMVFVDELHLQEELEDKVATLCKNIDHTMTDIFSLEAVYGDNGKAELTVQGTTDSDLEATCQVVARLGTTIQFTLKSFTVSDQEAPNQADQDAQNDDQQQEESAENSEATPPTEEETETDTDTAAGDETDGVTPPSFEDDDDTAQNTGNWLSYESVRGYTLSFSNQAISYAGQIRDEATSLGVDGISCDYQVNVIQRQRADQVDTNPDLIVYECTGDPNQGDIASNNLLFVGEIEDRVFVAKYLNSNLSTTQVAVQ